MAQMGLAATPVGSRIPRIEDSASVENVYEILVDKARNLDLAECFFTVEGIDELIGFLKKLKNRDLDLDAGGDDELSQFIYAVLDFAGKKHIPVNRASVAWRNYLAHGGSKNLLSVFVDSMVENLDAYKASLESKKAKVKSNIKGLSNDTLKRALAVLAATGITIALIAGSCGNGSSDDAQRLNEAGEVQD